MVKVLSFPLLIALSSTVFCTEVLISLLQGVCACVCMCVCKCVGVKVTTDWVTGGSVDACLRYQLLLHKSTVLHLYSYMYMYIGIASVSSV